MATVEQAARRVEAGTMSRAAYKEVRMAMGLRRNPLGVIADAELYDAVRPIETFTYDWVHTMLQGGVLNSEVEALLELSRIPRERLQKFLADATWVFPRASHDKARQLHRIFDERRVGDDDSNKVKASCSELLGVYGLLRFFMELELSGRPDMAAGLKSMMAVCRVIDLLLAAKRHQAAVDDVAGITGPGKTIATSSRVADRSGDSRLCGRLLRLPTR